MIGVMEMHYIFSNPVITGIVMGCMIGCIIPIAIVALFCWAGVKENRDKDIQFGTWKGRLEAIRTELTLEWARAHVNHETWKDTVPKRWVMHQGNAGAS